LWGCSFTTLRKSPRKAERFAAHGRQEQGLVFSFQWWNSESTRFKSLVISPSAGRSTSIAVGKKREVFKGKRFRIKTTTLGIAAVRNQRIPVAVPADATVEVISHTHGNRMIDVVWEGENLKMFAQDIRERGEEITDSK